MQQLYKAALSGLVEAQKPDALNDVPLQLGNKLKNVNIKIPIMYIIGDNQGGDTICGRKVYYGKMLVPQKLCMVLRMESIYMC